MSKRREMERKFGDLSSRDPSIDLPPERLSFPSELRPVLNMQSLPATEQLHEEVGLLEQQVREGGVDRWQDRATSLQRRLEFARSQLTTALERDELQRSRPEGCTCLAIGGHRPVIARSGAWYFDEYCTCPVGAKLQAEHQAEAQLLRNAAAQRKREAALAAFLDQVPLHFHALGQFPITTVAQRVALDDIKPWMVATAEEQSSPWLVLRGPPGRGKTAIAIAVTRYRLQAGLAQSADFTSVPDLLNRIKATYDRGKATHGEHESDVLEELRESELLVLDDLGAENTTAWSLERLFTLLNFRHGEHMSTVITTNLGPEELASRLGERLAWRMVEMSMFVSLEKCPNLRAKSPRPKLKVMGA